MNTTEYVAGTILSSAAPKSRRGYQRIYRGFPVLHNERTPSRLNHRTIVYRGVRGVFSNAKTVRSALSYQVIYRGFALHAMAA